MHPLPVRRLEDDMTHQLFKAVTVGDLGVDQANDVLVFRFINEQSETQEVSIPRALWAQVMPRLSAILQNQAQAQFLSSRGQLAQAGEAAQIAVAKPQQLTIAAAPLGEAVILEFDKGLPTEVRYGIPGTLAVELAPALEQAGRYCLKTAGNA